jgi:X-Pro dipeptidyl-peptidase (S15 family)
VRRTDYDERWDGAPRQCLPAVHDGSVPDGTYRDGLQQGCRQPTGQDCTASQGIAGDEPGLTEKGYAVMMFDDRGTGSSGGNWDSWGQRSQEDYKEVLTWIQAQSWSNSSVATTGESYMGITSLLLAEADAARIAEGKPRAALAPDADADARARVTLRWAPTSALASRTPPLDGDVMWR